MRRFFLLSACALAFLLEGCATTVNLHSVDRAALSGDWDETLKRWEAKEEEVRSVQGPIVADLDRGMLSYYAGRWEDSEDALSSAEKGIYDAYAVSISRSAASWIINDNTKEYPGEDFEDIYTNVFMAIDWYRMGSVADAAVEIRRAQDKQRDLATIYAADGEGKSVHFIHSALTDWLGYLFAEAQGDEADVLFYRRRIGDAFRTQPSLYPFALPSCCREDHAVPEGKVPLRFLAFTGLEPRKVSNEMTFPLPGTMGYNFVTVAVPILSPTESEIGWVDVFVDGSGPYGLETLEDLSLVAIDTYELKKEGIYAKAIARATGKAVGTEAVDIASHSAAVSQDSEDVPASLFLADLLTLGVGLFNNLSEHADVRMSHYLPAKALVAEVPVGEGEHTVEFRYYSTGGRLLKTDIQTVTALSGGVNLVGSACLR